MTTAGSDGHHRMPDASAVGAAEFNLDGFSIMRCTTSPIIADATVTGFIQLDAGTVPVFKSDSCW